MQNLLSQLLESILTVFMYSYLHFPGKYVYPPRFVDFISHSLLTVNQHLLLVSTQGSQMLWPFLDYVPSRCCLLWEAVKETMASQTRNYVVAGGSYAPGSS